MSTCLPAAGLSEGRWDFIWLQLPDDLSANEFFLCAAQEGVTFVPGTFFFPRPVLPGFPEAELCDQRSENDPGRNPAVGYCSQALQNIQRKW